jgi:NAD(P)H-dependent FMN reductase
MRPLSVPVILGTTRKGRMSAPAAQFIYGQLQKRDGITTELLDIARLNVPVDDAGEAIKDPGFSASMERSDAVVIVTPEYNHSFPGLLKHVLDSCLKEYIHKAAGIVAVSAGVYGGVRAVQNLLPVLRELGLVLYLLGCEFRDGPENLRRQRTTDRSVLHPSCRSVPG